MQAPRATVVAARTTSGCAEQGTVRRDGSVEAEALARRRRRGRCMADEVMALLLCVHGRESSLRRTQRAWT
jgi:hypothetical protein